ncbi:MAG: hypothetical protein ACOC2H_02525 [Spirochaetota bacterium]
MNETAVPDILIPFDPDSALASPCIVPLYVRPETNRVDYESLIAESISDIGYPVFMANYNGSVITRRHIIRNHYFYRYIFALHGKEEMKKYPEMIDAFESKFGVRFKDAPIYGAYEFLNRKELSGGMDHDLLFHHYVSADEYMVYLGISVKKVRGSYVINYDIPGIMERYTSNTNILVVMITPRSAVSFRDVNYAIYRTFLESDVSKLLTIEKSPELSWEERVKRTYHISHNHIEAMFDTTDFVLYKDFSPIHYIDTPLGRGLVDRSILNEGELDSILNYFKKFPILYARQNSNNRRLINLRITASYDERMGRTEMTFDQCVDLFRSVVA